MARKTAAERAKEERQKERAVFESLRDSWQVRLMTALSKLVELQGTDLVVTEGLDFRVRWYDVDNDLETVVLPLNLPEVDYWKAESALGTLECEVESRIKMRQEYERKQQLKREALSKLTDEEREALGL